MSARKKDWSDYADDFADKAERKGKRQAKRSIKNIHAATLVIAVLALIAGIVIGAVVCLSLFKNDRFVLQGRTQISLDAGTAYVYEEEGVEAVCFGMDVSGDLTVTLDEGIERDVNGNYVIPAEPGTYTITYTVDCYKFGPEGPNGQIKRIRVFTVNEVEEDGRNG
ncbi:MAG: hypothetical protein IKM08_00560 [Clostridia bacterium]|nr:hypothetical protein [Clostridia bacterium]